MMLKYKAKGLLTTKGGRGHVTKYTYCVTIKIQTLEPDIQKIVRKVCISGLYRAAPAHSTVIDYPGACGNLHPVLR